MFISRGVIRIDTVGPKVMMTLEYSKCSNILYISFHRQSMEKVLHIFSQIFLPENDDIAYNVDPDKTALSGAVYSISSVI